MAGITKKNVVYLSNAIKDALDTAWWFYKNLK